MKKKGISLVALVVTIIVLIILTGAVVATFMEGGIIDKAKDAVMRNDCETLKEAYVVRYNEAKIDIETGTGGEINISEIVMKSAEDVGLEKDFSMGETVIYTGENTEIQKWLATLGLGCASKEQAEFAGKINNNSYVYNNGYIAGIKTTGGSNELVYLEKSETTLEMLLAGEDISNYTIKNNITGTEKVATDYLSTGDEIYDKEGKLVGTVIMYGDLDGDGLYNVSDYANIINYINDEELQFNDAQLVAMDIDGDSIISTVDVMYLLYVGSGNITPSDLGINRTTNIRKQIPSTVVKRGEIIIPSYERLKENLMKKYEITIDKYENEDEGIEYEYINITMNEEVTLGDIRKILEENCDKYSYIYLTRLRVLSSETAVINTTNESTVIPNDASGNTNRINFKYGISENEAQTYYLNVIYK